MISIGLIALLVTMQSDSGAMRVVGREMVGLTDRENVIRGHCDGREASATITKPYQGRRGRLVLHAGRLAREVPPTFLNGSLFTNALSSIGIACDGRRLQLHALALRMDAQGGIVLDIQDAVMDLRTGALTTTEMRTLSPAETRAELGPN